MPNINLNNLNINLGLQAATTSDTNDSIVIQGAFNSLSEGNYLLLSMPSTNNPGLFVLLKQESDVTIDLTGANWGLGTLGDFTDVELRVYAINDTGVLKWGVSLGGGLTTITDTDTDTPSGTPANVNTKSKMLVNQALNAGTWSCVEVGWFKANFDDDGGSSPDLWEIQTDIGDINVGVPIKDKTDWEVYTPSTTGFGTVTGMGAVWRRVGSHVEVVVRFSSGTPTSVEARVTLPSNLIIGNLPSGSNIIGHFDRGTAIADSGAKYVIANNNLNYVTFGQSSGTLSAISTPSDADTIASDSVAFAFTASVPVVQWSSN